MRILLLACALALAACTQADDAPAPVAVQGTNCPASATKPWRPLSGAEFTVEAFTNGPDCTRAVATLVIRNVQGEPLWTEAAPTRHIMVLAPAHDAAAMQAALEEWVDASNNTTMTTTGALPDWPRGADAPASGEFPFYPEAYLDRESYMALRQSNLPLFCYVQGMESMGCLSLRDGQLEKVGVQAFPG